MELTWNSATVAAAWLDGFGGDFYFRFDGAKPRRYLAVLEAGDYYVGGCR
jgi:hypothetical protein